MVGASDIVPHNKWAWSNDNKNVIGKIITSYSSQTTAHILDAIKEGTIYNENEFTFGAFKTLLDLGVDYDTTISFIMQPAISIINDAYFESNSLYINSFGNPIDTALKNIASRLGIEYNNKPVDKYTPINYIKSVKYFPHIDDASVDVELVVEGEGDIKVEVFYKEEQSK